MANESCLHCGQPAESDRDVVTRAGAVHEGCWATYSGDNDSQASRPMHFLGAILRFLGMIVNTEWTENHGDAVTFYIIVRPQ